MTSFLDFKTDPSSNLLSTFLPKSKVVNVFLMILGYVSISRDKLVKNSVVSFFQHLVLKYCDHSLFPPVKHLGESFFAFTKRCPGG